MAHALHDGAAAPGVSTPEKNNAQQTLGAVGSKEQSTKLDCEAKAIATATARAALLGLEAEDIGAGKWRLRTHAGYLGTLPDMAAMVATLTRLERERGAS